MDWVLKICGTQVTKEKRPVWPVFPDYLSVSYDYVLAKWLSVRFRTKWLWVPVPLMSVSTKVFFDIQATIGCRFTLKRVRDMIATYSYLVTFFVHFDFAWISEQN